METSNLGKDLRFLKNPMRLNPPLTRMQLNFIYLLLMRHVLPEIWEFLRDVGSFE